MNVKVVSLVLRLLVAVILVQTLFFKFSGAQESVYIFTTVGLEPVGRYATGTVELIASVLLFIPSLRTVGAILAIGTMSGAIFFHLTKLGIVVEGDHGLLFGMACTVFLSCLVLLWIHRRELPIVGVRLWPSLFVLLCLVSPTLKASAPLNLSDGLAVHGYDPVCYLDESRSAQGSANFEFKWKGAEYRFVSAAHQEAFRKNPNKYAPAYGGWCAYAMSRGEMVDVDPTNFKVVHGRTMLFFKSFFVDTRVKWNDKESELLPEADASWKTLNQEPGNH